MNRMDRRRDVCHKRHSLHVLQLYKKISKKVLKKC